MINICFEQGDKLQVCEKDEKYEKLHWPLQQLRS